MEPPRERNVKEQNKGRFAEYFAEVVDPRRRDGDHDLTEMLFIALLAAVRLGRDQADPG